MKAVRKAKYIVLEGTDGVGKGTQIKKLSKHLTDKGFKVFVTSEPGNSNYPFTMDLRKIVLDNANDLHFTTPGREMILQTIRSIHLEKIVYPALIEYDYIIQDRGMVSALAYGHGCGNSYQFMKTLLQEVVTNQGKEKFGIKNFSELYDQVIIFQANPTKSLARAKNSKQEFAAGDAMEARGNDFMTQVARNFEYVADNIFPRVKKIIVDDKDIQQVFKELTTTLGI